MPGALAKKMARKEITMDQSQEHKDASPAKTDSRLTSRLGHWGRVTVMILSCGFIFPNALIEDEDIAKDDTHKDDKVKEQ
jgi:hypothetical protein